MRSVTPAPRVMVTLAGARLRSRITVPSGKATAA